MGRYTTVQAYADKSAGMRSISYEQATSASTSTTAANDNDFVRPEKVENPYGSTAGAGSGNFHVYRHARAREKERLKQMDDNEYEQKIEADFQQKVEQNAREDELKTEKNRKKRQRAKEAKRRKKNLKLSGVDTQSNDKSSPDIVVDEDEFHYVPILDQKKKVDEAKEEIHSPPKEEKKEIS